VYALLLLVGSSRFGKTTLLSESVNQLQEAVGWVSLDEGDKHTMWIDAPALIPRHGVRAGWSMYGRLLAADQGHIDVAVTHRHGERVEPRQFVITQGNLCRCDVFFQVVNMPRAWDRHDILALR
jgi:hypothetical protein